MERETLLKIIQEYKEKISRYEAMVEEWQKELGIPGQPILVSPEQSNQDDGHDDTVREWQFYGKSQPEAVKALLEHVGHPLKTEQIVEHLEKGGVTVGGNTKQKKATNLYTILHRSEDFAIVSGKRGSWGLVGWPGVKKKQDESDSPETEEQEVKETA
jgi:hypothetical protein